MKAHLKQIRISPKKANLVAHLVRQKSIEQAVNILKFTNKKSAPVLKKLIESASANAINNFKQNKDDLYIKEILVTEGPVYKRGVPVSRGRVHPILKRTSHITIKLGLKTEANAKKTEPEATQSLNKKNSPKTTKKETPEKEDLKKEKKTTTKTDKKNTTKNVKSKKSITT